jgi:hypothetical protein
MDIHFVPDSIFYSFSKISQEKLSTYIFILLITLYIMDIHFVPDIIFFFLTYIICSYL